MIYLKGNSRKNYKVKLFSDIGILTCQKPDKIYRIKKLGTVSTEF